MILLFVYLSIALLVSFTCSIMEAVILTTPLTYARVREESGSKSAKTFIRLKENIDRPITAILTLNTIAHTIGAAGVGAQAIKVFGDAYFGLVSVILTLLILVFSEIIPKSIGARYARELSLVSGKIIVVMMWITYPFVLFSGIVTRIVAKKGSEQTVSREEISVLASIGRTEGVFEEKEQKIIQNLVRLKSVSVSEIMTPRVVLTAADENMELQEFLKKKEFLYYSRIPVYSGYFENITGYVFREQVFEKLAEDHNNLKLSDIRRDIVVFYQSKPLFNVWETLLEKKEQIAIVVDEYGGIEGVVTMEDIVETLLGFEIVDEKDKIPDLQQYARERWKKRKQKYDMLDNREEKEGQQENLPHS
jgi:CBS domain containing-hemolysin-like protein